MAQSKTTGLIPLLGFGCASVGGRISKSKSIDALTCAFDLGITHFDVAHSYGFGDAEAILGSFLRNKRSDVTLTSKFGVVVPNSSDWQKLARPLIRPLLPALKPLARYIRNNSKKLLAERDYTVPYAQKCLEGSLRRLKTEYIDYYLIHEPTEDVLSNIEPIAEFLESAVQDGKIRAWGIAHSDDVINSTSPFKGSIIQSASVLDQIEFKPMFDVFEKHFITKPFAGGRSEVEQSVALSAAARNTGLGLMEAAMHWACYQTGASGSVICGMYEREHIRKNADSVRNFLANPDLLSKSMIAELSKSALRIESSNSHN